MNSKSMAGWIGFAGIVMLIIGAIDFFQGLIALLEDEYFVLTGSGFLVFDLTGWGWLLLIWGSLLVLAGLGLLAGQDVGALVRDRGRLAELPRPARLHGQQQTPALGTDRDSVEHHRALRADCPLEREQGRARHQCANRLSEIEAVARRARRPIPGGSPG